MRKQNCEPEGVGWRDAVSLGEGQRPLSLFVQMTSSFYYPRYPCCPQRKSSYFLPAPALSQWLAWNFTEAAWSNLQGMVESVSCRRSCFSLAVSFPSAVHTGLLTAALNCCHVWILLLLCTHRWQNALISIGSSVWSKWCIKVWEKGFCLTSQLCLNLF